MKVPIPVRFAWLLVACFMAGRAAPAEPEDALKAAIVLSFLHYTEWSPPLPAGTPIVVGVYGRPSFAQVLRRSSEGKVVNGHTVQVTELKNAGDLQGSQVVYFASDRAGDIKPVLTAARPFTPLAIGEAGSFLDWGGAVNLVVIDGRMSFEVSLDALRRSGANVSSRLLRFGQIHHGGKGDGSS